MVKIINELGFGGRLGSALGGGLGEGLNALAQHKMDTMVRDKQASETAKVIKMFNPGISDAEAHHLARAPEYYQKMVAERGITQSGGEQAQYGSPQDTQITGDPQGLKLGMTQKEKQEKQKQIYEFKKLNEAQGKIADKELSSIDTALKLIDKAKKENISKPGAWTKTIYGDDPLKVTNNPTLQRLAQLYENIATDETIKTLEQSGSKAGASFLQAVRAGKASIFQDYDVQQDILKDLRKHLVPLSEDSKKVKAIIEKNKGQTPLDLIEQFENLNRSEIDEQQAAPSQEQEQAPEGTTVEQNGVIFKRVKNQWVPVG